MKKAKRLSRSKRAERRKRELRRRRLTYGLAALLLAVSVGAILLGVGQNGDSGSAPEVSLDKSQGPADAPVVVTEYGDFQ